MHSRTLVQLLGYAGLLPFAAGAIGTLVLQDDAWNFARHAFMVYSLAILCFLAGTLWGSAIDYPQPQKMRRLLISNGIVIFAVTGILTDRQWLAALLLILGYLAVLWYEQGSKGSVGWYMGLRARLTWVAVATHLLYIVGLVIHHGGRANGW